MRFIRLASTAAASGALAVAVAVPAVAAGTSPTPGTSPTSTTSPTPSSAPTEPAGAPHSHPTSPPTPPPPLPDPSFKFGYDKVKLSTHRVVPGGTVTITVTCPTAVAIAHDVFVPPPGEVIAPHDPLFLDAKQIGPRLFRAVGTFQQHLPKVGHVVIACAYYGYLSFTLTPDRAGGSTSVHPSTSTPKVPVGAPETGDGSLSGTREVGNPRHEQG